MLLFGIAIFIFLIVCIVLVFLVLIQSDKGGGISGAIGGGLSNASSMLGSQDTANILTRGTTIFASSYMVICILLSLFLSKTVDINQKESVLKKRAETQESYSPSSVLPLGTSGSQEEGAILPPSPENTEE